MEAQPIHGQAWQSDLDLCSRGRHLLKSGLRSDVQFTVGEQKELIKAHRLVLASASPVFAGMLYGPSAEETSPIHIPDATLESFNLLLEYIYTDNIEDVTIEIIPELDKLAKKYQVPRLLTACAKTLTKNVCPKDAVRCYDLAKAIEYQPLIDACVKVFKLYTMPILEAESTLGTNIDTMEFIFSLDNLSVNSELDLLTIVEKYAKANEDKKVEGDDDTHMKSVRRLLQKIRFLSLSLQELAQQHRRLRAFLSDSELLSLVICYNCPDEAAMPEGFTTDKTKRSLTIPFLREIPGEVVVGRVFKLTGIVKENPDRFNINLRRHEFNFDGWDDDDEEEDNWEEDIFFHMSVRFLDVDENHPAGVVVRNTFREASGNWEEEEREGGMPFEAGVPFDLTIEVKNDGFKPTPFITYAIPYAPGVGASFRVSGSVIQGSPERINVNLRGENSTADGWNDPSGDTEILDKIHLHLSFRFEGEHSEVVINYYDDGWSNEGIQTDGMPVIAGGPFNIVIELTEPGFEIHLNGQHYANYDHNNLPYEDIHYINVKGDVAVTEIS